MFLKFLVLILLVAGSLNAWADDSLQLDLKCSGVPIGFPPANGVTINGILGFAMSSQKLTMRFNLIEHELSGADNLLQREYIRGNSGSSSITSTSFLCGNMQGTHCAELSYETGKDLKALILGAKAGAKVDFQLSFDPSTSTHTYSYFFKLNCHL